MTFHRSWFSCIAEQIVVCQYHRSWRKCGGETACACRRGTDRGRPSVTDHGQIVPARDADCGLVPQITEEIMDVFSCMTAPMIFSGASMTHSSSSSRAGGDGVARSFTPRWLVTWVCSCRKMRHCSESVQSDVESRWRWHNELQRFVATHISTPFSPRPKQQQYNLERLRFSRRGASTPLWRVEPCSLPRWRPKPIPAIPRHLHEAPTTEETSMVKL